MADKLDQEKLRAVLEQADDAWYSKHYGEFSYQKYLDFISGYLAVNYHKKLKGQKRLVLAGDKKGGT